MIGIYKITNKINGKCYIGQSINIEERLNSHKKRAFNQNHIDYNMTIYKVIRKYGIESFTFEAIEECDKKDLDNREVYWINFFNSYYNGYNCTFGGRGNNSGINGSKHPNHCLVEQDIINIRTEYKNHKRKKDVYKLYKDKIGKSGFDKIWKGETWKNIMPEIYNETNKLFHKNNTGNIGSTNGRSKLTEENVANIRMLRKNGAKINDIYVFYKDLLTFRSFEQVWYNQNWKHVIV